MMKLCLWMLSAASLLLLTQAITINELFNKFCPHSINASNEATISVSEGKPCIIRESNLKITGHQQYNKTIVNCIKNTSNGYSGRAIVFQNVTNITLEYLEFWNCQGNLTATVTGQHPSMYYCFRNNQSGLLYFSNCSGVSIQNVNFIYETGIMIALVNTDAAVKEVKTDGSSMDNCSNTSNIPSSGILIYYYGESSMSKMVNITKLVATRNKDCSYSQGCHYYNMNLQTLTNITNHHVLRGLSAVTIVFAQQNFDGKVNITMSTIKLNLGVMSSGMLILYLYAHNTSYVHLDGVEFDSNKLLQAKQKSQGHCTGSALQLGIFHTNADTTDIQSKNWTALKVSNSNVTNHGNTAIRIATRENPNSIIISFYKVNFESNTLDHFFYGICIVAEGIYGSSASFIKLQIVLELVTAKKNSVQYLPFETHSTLKVPLTSSGIFVFTNLDAVIIKGPDTGNCSNVSNYSYSNNNAAVFVGIGTDFTLVNKLCFYNNKATTGAAFYLSSFSHLFISSNAYINFMKNHVTTVGGAIATTTIGNAGSMCVIQLPSNQNYIMTFTDNTADLGGSAVYGSPLYECQQIALPNINMSNEYFHSGHFVLHDPKCADNRSQIQSIPWQVVHCHNETWNKPRNVAPGTKLDVNITVVDIMNNAIASKVYIYLKRSKDSVHHSDINYKLRAKCSSDQVHDICQTVKIQICSTQFGQADLELATETSIPTLSLKLNITHCPIGFQLVKSGRQKGICNCNKFIRFIQNKIYKRIYRISCNITNGTINRQTNFWLGQIVDQQTLGFSELCPWGYCTTDTDFRVDKPDTLCCGNRHGKICGSCKEGYSTVFGASTCHKCHNLWLLSALAYTAFGIALVIIMYALQLTLDKGTVGGVIFYANTVMLGIFYINSIYHEETSFYGTYIYFMNLSINFKMCFYNGMTDTVKVALKFIFPFYMWLLVGIIVVASRHSTKISRFTSKRSVQVLITLVHLSLARLLITVLEIVVYTKLYMGDDNNNNHTRDDNNSNHTGDDNNSNHYEVVWLTSGEVKYGRNVGHIFLLVGAISTTLFILIPYWLITSLAPWCYGCYIVNRLKPVFDSIYAPYKTSKRYWFGVRQTLLVFFYICFAASISGSRAHELAVAQTWIIAAFTVLQLFLHPFRNPWIHFVDSFYMILLTAMAGVIIKAEKQDVNWIALRALSAMGLAMLVCIIIYHVLLALDVLSSCIKKWRLFKQYIKRKFLVNDLEELSTTVQGSRRDEYMSIVGSNNLRYNSNRLRESLLSERHIPI